MKRLITGLCIITIFMAIGTACASRTADITFAPSPSEANLAPDAKSNIPITPTNPAPNPQPSVVVNVDDLMASPDRYVGPIWVEGVVSFVSPGQRTLGLIDSREFAACGTTTCSSFILPIQWSGPMPRVEDIVQVVGEIQKSSGKFIFVAQVLESTKQQTGSPK